MTPLALLFMVLSWSFVLGLAGWCFHRVLRARAPTHPAGPHGRGGSGPGTSGPERDRERAAGPGAEEISE